MLCRCSWPSANKPPINLENKPNILLFYVDDLGFGDLSCYGAQGVETPHVDALAQGGLRFTDAHSAAATSTPSWYSLMTGEYAFRRGARFGGHEVPLLIDTSRTTLPKLLQQAGYATGVIGKWHLGLGNGQVDWNRRVKPGPTEVGFDYSFHLPSTGDRVPTVFLENGNVVGLDRDDPLRVTYRGDLGQTQATQDNARFVADYDHSRTLVNGVGRMGSMTGGAAARWNDEDLPYTLTNRAMEFLYDHQREPFFLFFAFNDIHVPRLPHERFRGQSSMGPRGDAIVQMDWMTGRIMQQLEKLDLAENTLVIFTSDNGPILNDGYEDFALEMLGNHRPGGPYRGAKYSAFEAGTRVPMIAFWPGNIESGTSSALFSQVDLFSSIAQLVGLETPKGEGGDSEPLMNVLLGRSQQGRAFLLEQSYTLSIRSQKWKYIEPKPAPETYPKWLLAKKIEHGLSSTPQLYNLVKDPGEMINVVYDNPEVAEELAARLEAIVAEPM